MTRLPTPERYRRIKEAHALEFSFLAAQTLGDGELEGELLALFVAQGRRVIAALPHQDAVRQDLASHLLKGSALAVGAATVADAAAAFERAAPEERARCAYRDLVAAFTEAETAIAARLSSTGRLFPSDERVGRDPLFIPPGFL